VQLQGRASEAWQIGTENTHGAFFIMSRSRRITIKGGSCVLLMAVAGCMMTATAAAQTRDDDTERLRADIEALKTRVAAQDVEIARLRQDDGEAWLTEQRAAEVRALVQDVLTDADARSSLLEDGMTAGHDGKFFMASADGNFRMDISGFMQFRYVFNNQEDGGDPAFDSTRQGFENRRTKLVFSGHVVDPTWQYKLQASFENAAGGPTIVDDALIRKDFENGWNVTFGQFKLPFLREDLMPAWKQLAVERSLVFSEFRGGRSQAVQVEYRNDRWKADLAISDGFSATSMPALVEDVEGFAVTGRVEALVDGSWSQFGDLTSWRGEEFGLLLGGAAHYQKSEFGTATGPEEEMFSWTADASAEFGGANLFGAIVGRHFDVMDVDQIGIVVQGGHFFTDTCEAFARYEWGDFDTTGVEDLSVITVGINKYFKKHNLKWTTDVGFGLDEVNPVWSSSGAGWRSDPAGEDSQIVVRSQFQLAY